MATHSKVGKRAEPSVVDLYRAAYNADHPLTFGELVDAMPSAYQNDANRAYAKYWDEMGNDPIPDPWSRRQLRTALEWWVAEVLDATRRNRHLVATSLDGSRAWGKPRQLLVYTANRDHPPLVLEQYLADRTVRWTPEIGATGRRHVAGIKFRDEMVRIQASDAKLTTKQDLEKRLATLEQALKLAAEALAYDPTA